MLLIQVRLAERLMTYPTHNGVCNQFYKAICATGMQPPEKIVPDGKIHRFASDPTRRGNDAWYCLYVDGIPAGAFGSWRTDLKQTWRMVQDRPLTPAECTHRQPDSDASKRTEMALRLWSEVGPAAGTLVETYLLGRGISVAPPCTLRFATLNHSSCGHWPVMVALVTNADGTPQAIHRSSLLRMGPARHLWSPRR